VTAGLMFCRSRGASLCIRIHKIDADEAMREREQLIESGFDPTRYEITYFRCSAIDRRIDI
jgi:hypothetical protein